MAYIHAVTGEWVGTIVYWGPGRSGKTSSIKCLHDQTPPERRGRLQMLSTETEQPASFEFLPLSLGTIHGVNIRLHLYTTFGHVSFEQGRRPLVPLADGVVFVADSHPDRQDANEISYQEWQQAYADSDTPPSFVLQCNKQDLPQALAPSLVASRFCVEADNCIASGATKSSGVYEALLRSAHLALLAHGPHAASLQTRVTASSQSARL